MTAHNSTQRFGNRVEDYVKYRPGYPAAVITYLQEQYGLAPGNTVADIGAGTGISSAIFLQAGYKVLAVEPNTPMREKSVELLGQYPNFTAVDGSAEQTGLPAGCADAVVAGQAFHWFNAAQTRPEFQRILKPGGVVVLIWNERLTEGDFEQAYDELIIRHGSDYTQVDHRKTDERKIGQFFSPSTFDAATFPNQQVFDFDGLKGRLSSSSYVPAPDEPGYGPMIEDLRTLFDQYQQHNAITVRYTTKLYAGRL